MSKIKICICGAGNMAHALIAYTANNDKYEFNILSSKNENWTEIKGYDEELVISTGSVNLVTKDASLVIPDSDIIILTVPIFARKKLLKKISPFVKEGVLLGAFPGVAGFDIEVEKYIKNDSINIFSTQRVPYISRIIEKGEKVNATPKDSINVAILKNKNIVKTLLEDILKIKVNVLDNFMEVNLSNSNPILHTSRIYSLFKDLKKETAFKKEILFYENWNDDASEILLKMDKEFMLIVKKNRLKNVKSLKKHYEVSNVREMTSKITSIHSFKGIKLPMISNLDGSFKPDIESRYFTEDFKYGLKFIENAAKILNIETPLISKVLNWSHNFIK